VPPKPNVPDLPGLRAEIDRIDADILRLLNERGRVAQEVAHVKRSSNQSYYAPHREEQLLARLRELNRDGSLPDDAIAAIYREIISACRALEAELRIAYLGPEASFTHIASRRQFGSSAVYAPCPTQADIFREVERGAAHYGVVPIENSTMGVVIESLDLFARSPLTILGEILLGVTHNLLSNCSLEAIQRVYSHRQAFAQCREWLAQHLPNVDRFEISSTAEAARRAATEDGTAAIASELAAETYSLTILHRHIEDSPDNTTRFLVVGSHEVEPTGDDKTSLLFTVRHEVGALVRVLNEFAAHGINVMTLQSRPSRIRSWEYLFFADLAGHAKDDAVKAALSQIEPLCLYVKVLGAYPRG